MEGADGVLRKYFRKNNALNVFEKEHLVNFDNTKLLSKYWLIQRDRINAEQWFISHQAKALKLKALTQRQVQFKLN